MTTNAIRENVSLLIELYNITPKSSMKKYISSLSKNYIYAYYMLLCDKGLIDMCDIFIDDGRIFVENK